MQTKDKKAKDLAAQIKDYEEIIRVGDSIMAHTKRSLPREKHAHKIRKHYKDMQNGEKKEFLPDILTQEKYNYIKEKIKTLKKL